jgi:hypothetical protein
VFALIAKFNGAEPIGVVVVFLVVSLIGVGVTIVWERAVKPTGARLREEGLVGVGKTVEQKVAEAMKPILYGKHGKLSDEIRGHVKTKHINPARTRKQVEVSLRAGDIHRELNLQDRMPAVCSVLGSQRLQQESGVALIARSGPQMSSTSEFRFKIL